MKIEFHQKQSAAFRSRATEILYGGAAGPGKSFFLRAISIFWAMAIPGLQVYLFRLTHPDLIANHMDGDTGFPSLLAEHVKAKKLRINYSDNKIYFNNKSIIHLCHCQNDKDVYNHQGTEMNLLGIDELTQFNEFKYRYLRSRVRVGSLPIPEKFKDLFPRIVCCSNPGNIGHQWVKSSFIDAAQPMECWCTPDKEGGFIRQFIPALLTDNPYIEADYEKRLEGMGAPELVRAYKYGDWDIVAGGMFDDLWDRDVHVIEPFEIPQSWRVFRTYDWGSAKPFSVGWWAVSDGTQPETLRYYPRGTLIRIAEWYGWSGKPNEGVRILPAEIAEGIKERESMMGVRVAPGPADPSIYDNSTGVSIGGEMSKYGVNFTPANATPGSRVFGWQLMRKRLAAAKETPLEHPALFVFSTCLQFIRTVPTAIRDPKKPDDIDTKSEDHILDETRYAILGEESQGRRVRFSA